MTLSRRDVLRFSALVPLALAGTGMALPARAQVVAKEIALTAAQKGLVKKVEAYMNGITTLQSTFFQQSSNNEFAEGEIFLSRPGKIRIEYKPPVKILIVAKGKYLAYMDKELNQVTYVPVEDTPAAFLLTDKIRLDPGRVIFNEVAEEDGAIYISVSDRKDPFSGRLTLVFRSQPLSLRKWSVTDAQGIITDIVLTDAFFGGALEDKLFVLPEASAPDARE